MLDYALYNETCIPILTNKAVGRSFRYVWFIIHSLSYQRVGSSMHVYINNPLKTVNPVDGLPTNQHLCVLMMIGTLLCLSVCKNAQGPDCIHVILPR